ncbi:hypothetical protein lerEdw1_002555 [Lerista edwardsae]|nr:hypothetical protein lerEdw1_002555 [Lerista edwardsae]
MLEPNLVRTTNASCLKECNMVHFTLNEVDINRPKPPLALPTPLPELPELRGKPGTIDRPKPLSPPLRRDFVPEEILVALTSAANPIPCPSFLRPPKKTKSTKDFQGCLRTADGVWQHADRRTKFQYLIQHPISLTGAGRQVQK